MQHFLFLLKQQVNILSLLLFLLLAAAVARRFRKRKLTGILLISCVVIFLLSSTAYLPRYLTQTLESKYPPFDTASYPGKSDPVLIHVLGSGYNLDERLPPNAKLALVALGRLTEAVRIYHALPNSTIVCSGNSMLGLKTQAEVTLDAALSLGIDSTRAAVLTTPATTLEEAKDLKKKYGTAVKLIIVTDALHMQRAMNFFKAQGFQPTPAPTNYKIPLSPSAGKFKWWPSTTNIDLTDLVLHEYLGSLKAAL